MREIYICAYIYTYSQSELFFVYTASSEHKGFWQKSKQFSKPKTQREVEFAFN